MVDDADRQTVVCFSEDCRELHINDKRHYAWTFQNNQSHERLRILGAHLASGDTTKDHLNHATDLASIRTTLEENYIMQKTTIISRVKCRVHEVDGRPPASSYIRHRILRGS